MGNYPDTKRKLDDSSLDEKQLEESVVELPKKYVYYVTLMPCSYVGSKLYVISLRRVAVPHLGEIFRSEVVVSTSHVPIKTNINGRRLFNINLLILVRLDCTIKVSVITIGILHS